MYVTRHSNLTDPVLGDKLWALYEASFIQVSANSPSHEMLFRDEFDEALREPTNRIWVLWDDAAPIAMTLIATEIAPVRYLSRNFFDGRYPDHSRRGAIHYIMFLVVHPVYAAQGAIVRLAKEVLQREAADGALLVFDTPDYHQSGARGGFAEMMDRLSKAFVGPAPVVHLGTQQYYAVDFSVVESPDEVDPTQPLRVPEQQTR